MSMIRLVGVDPGSRRTGFGVIDVVGGRVQYVDSGVIRINEADFPARLKVIFRELGDVLAHYQPHEVAVEDVFMANNAASALKLGQARGAAIVAAVNLDIPVHEYAARQVKLAVVGRGGAEKAQVQHMVASLLKLSAVPQEDAADALAVALCHAYARFTLGRISGAQNIVAGRASGSGSRRRGGRWQSLPSKHQPKS